MEIIVIIFSLVVFFNGIFTLFYRPYLEWIIKFENKIQGDVTEITKETVLFAKIAAFISVIGSVIFIYIFLFKP